mmetsp:Transcript_64735/g.166580  ORF Transcript_64735/g.166580 Transcript_64735/m.166580 type:complete len:273 (-) Transcript_64735:202-1020(-)
MTHPDFFAGQLSRCCDGRLRQGHPGAIVKLRHVLLWSHLSRACRHLLGSSLACGHPLAASMFVVHDKRGLIAHITSRRLMHHVGNGWLAPRPLALAAHAHDAGHVLLRLNHALGQACAHRRPGATMGLRILHTASPGPVTRVARPRELSTLDVQLRGARGRPHHFQGVLVSREVLNRGHRGWEALHLTRACHRQGCLRLHLRLQPAPAVGHLPSLGLASAARSLLLLGAPTSCRRLLFDALFHEAQGHLTVAQLQVISTGAATNGRYRVSCP